MPKRTRTNVAASGSDKPDKPVMKSEIEMPIWFESLYSGAMSAEYKQYMKEEWGHEKRGDVPLFEKMALEGAQAGLSWATILHKRDGYRQAFHNFDIDKCAGMTPADVARLMDAQTATIVRNRAKIEAVINNAKCVQQLIASADGPAPTHGHFDAFLWSFVGGTPQLNAWPDPKSIPCESDTAHEMSKALKAKGFKFVGPKMCYSLMQSCGLIIDHPKGTPEWEAARRRLESRATGEKVAETKPATNQAKRRKR